MSTLDQTIESLFNRALDGNAKIKDDMVGTVITDKKVQVIQAKSAAILDIESKLHEASTEAGKAALNECLKALVKA